MLPTALQYSEIDLVKTPLNLHWITYFEDQVIKNRMHRTFITMDFTDFFFQTTMIIDFFFAMIYFKYLTYAVADLITNGLDRLMTCWLGVFLSFTFGHQTDMRQKHLSWCGSTPHLTDVERQQKQPRLWKRENKWMRYTNIQNSNWILLLKCD